MGRVINNKEMVQIILLAICAIFVFSSQLVLAGGGGSSSSSSGSGGFPSHQPSPSPGTYAVTPYSSTATGVANTLNSNGSLAPGTTAVVTSNPSTGTYTVSITNTSSGSGSSGWPGSTSSGSTSSGSTSSGSGSSGTPIVSTVPTVDVSARQISGSNVYPSPGTYNVSATDITTGNIEISWTAVNFGAGVVCNGSNDFASMSGGGTTGSVPPSATAGENPVPGGPAKDYTVTCTDTNGNTDNDTVSLQIPSAPSSTTMNVRLGTDPGWPSPPWDPATPFVIAPNGPTSNIHLSWSSQGATACQEQAGAGTGNFSTDNSQPVNSTGVCPATDAPGDPVACMDTGVTEPDLGDYGVYTVRCTSLGGSETTSIEVHRPAPAPILNVFETGTNNPVNLVDIGTTVDIDWDLNGNDPADCTLTGPNWAGPAPMTIAGVQPIVIRGESTFTLDCSAAAIVSPLTGQPINSDHTVTREVDVTGNLMET